MLMLAQRDSRQMQELTSPLCVASPSGLRFFWNVNGSIQRIEHGDVTINLFLGNEVEGGPANLYLRRHKDPIDIVPLLGPYAPGRVVVSDRAVTAEGEWQGLCFRVRLLLARSAPAWFWHVAVENRGAEDETIDFVYVQDLALAPYGAARMNEYYVSQYVDYTPLSHPRCGTVLAVRQNLPVAGRHPWMAIGSLVRGVAFATDAMQVHGFSTRAGDTPAGLRARRLPGKRFQHEHSMAAIQDDTLSLPPGRSARRGFFAWFAADHQAASSADDLAFVNAALALPEARPKGIWLSSSGRRQPRETFPPIRKGSASLFTTSPLLASLDLSEAEVATLFGSDLHHVERENGNVLSFFTADCGHVVLKAKELRVLRPHGHILRSGSHLTPDEASLTSTTWMAGVFHSMVTQGHVSINRFLSTVRSYLGLLRSGGQRVFVELEDGYHLLAVPSAYEILPSGCRWFYRHGSGLIEVNSWAPVDRHELYLSLRVRSGGPCRFLISHHVALNGDDGAGAVPVRFATDENGVIVYAVDNSDVGRRFPAGFFRIDSCGDTKVEHLGRDELLFLDGRSRSQPFLVLVTAKTWEAGFRITGHLVAGNRAYKPCKRSPRWHDDQERARPFWRSVTAPLGVRSHGELESAVRCLQDILPWFAHNALVHYLAPRGLEQFSGGGWGTRDVCQGPVEMLLALGRWEPLRDLLVRVFRAQNRDGDWPQWFMFFERERDIRPPDSHGDIVFWPLLALGRYLLAAEDASILDAVVPFFHPEGDGKAEHVSIWGHVERALQRIERMLIPGANLAAFGRGDWNDSLQPVDPRMCERLCSAWTVTLHYQTLTTLACALRRVGQAGPAARLEDRARQVGADFRRWLMPDGIVAGYAYFHPKGSVDYLLHPRDEATGIRYSLLPMIHAIINDMLTPAQAAAHVQCIRTYLLGRDGARLFDRPFPYRGGPQVRFQRAESSSFFGREIGLMYMHAHLRYAEAMARYGDAEALFLALRQTNPLGLRSVVPDAGLRQANCYYSSSDAFFPDRYTALAEYEKVQTGGVPFEGGWRVYSSGAGIALRLIHECFLGIRRTKSALLIDPVIPRLLDGLEAELEADGSCFCVRYHVGRHGCGVQGLLLNGRRLTFRPLENPYRPAGAEASLADVTPLLVSGMNTLEVQIG